MNSFSTPWMKDSRESRVGLFSFCTIAPLLQQLLCRTIQAAKIFYRVHELRTWLILRESKYLQIHYYIALRVVVVQQHHVRNFSTAAIFLQSPTRAQSLSGKKLNIWKLHNSDVIGRQLYSHDCCIIHTCKYVRALKVVTVVVS